MLTAVRLSVSVLFGVQLPSFLGADRWPAVLNATLVLKTAQF